MDIHLPGISVIKCVRKLNFIYPEMQFIMCTIFQDDENVFNAMKAGVSGYMLKMDEPERIIESIKEIHRGGSLMNPQIVRKLLELLGKPHLHESAQLLIKREMESLNYLVKGLRYNEIADILFISIDTVRKHINTIYLKLQVQSRIQAINKVFGR
jgi:DNA-binding NarL/FixJ family response regulator